MSFLKLGLMLFGPPQRARAPFDLPMRAGAGLACKPTPDHFLQLVVSTAFPPLPGIEPLDFGDLVHAPSPKGWQRGGLTENKQRGERYDTRGRI